MPYYYYYNNSLHRRFYHFFMFFCVLSSAPSSVLLSLSLVADHSHPTTTFTLALVVAAEDQLAGRIGEYANLLLLLLLPFSPAKCGVTHISSSSFSTAFYRRSRWPLRCVAAAEAHTAGTETTTASSSWSSTQVVLYHSVVVSLSVRSIHSWIHWPWCCEQW